MIHLALALASLAVTPTTAAPPIAPEGFLAPAEAAAVVGLPGSSGIDQRPRRRTRAVAPTLRVHRRLVRKRDIVERIVPRSLLHRVDPSVPLLERDLTRRCAAHMFDARRRPAEQRIPLRLIRAGSLSDHTPIPPPARPG